MITYDLRETMRRALTFFALPGEDSVDRFERIADEYRRDTGKLAPGKDCPMAAGTSEDRASRMAHYDAWLAARVAAALDAIPLLEALAAAEAEVAEYRQWRAGKIGVEEYYALRLESGRKIAAAEARPARLREAVGMVVEWVDDLQDGGALEHALEIKADCLAALAATGEQP